LNFTKWRSEQIFEFAFNSLVGLASQFESDTNNFVLKKLKQHPQAYDTSPRFIGQLNLEADPLSKEHIICFIKSIFNDSQICYLFFYTNDLYVLVDVILRDIMNLGSTNQDDKLRHLFLELLESLLLYSQYSVSAKHKPQEIKALLEQLIQDSDNKLAKHAQHVLEAAGSVLVM